MKRQLSLPVSMISSPEAVVAGAIGNRLAAYAAMIAETEERPVREYRKAPPEQVANANEKSRLGMQQFRARLSPEEQAAVRERNRLQKRKARVIAKQRKGVLEDSAMSGNST
ncbi:hypothetical protein [Albibacillus kandeliae]|uniref:hypothetical protein n=1 Tax=Albibacillus kandeliae TaxID=2174228 RepID=UPI0013001C40|nr:hypothetical protein [Albibacillus kandeliae]